TTYPSNRRNPANQLSYPDRPGQMSSKQDADSKYQLSPRFGLSYQLSNTALLRFSYGHFFQVPPMYAMYANNSQLVAPTDYATQSGNPQLNAEKTVKYEVGLWQELMKDMGLEVTLFYQDIYDLLSMRVISTYNQIQYGLYTNKDYGNSKGLEVKYDIKYENFAAMVNYTLQYTRGNADNPTMTFDRAGDSMDPIARLIPMSWDQRHTLNMTLNYVLNNFNATLTGYFNSGSPYTWVPIAESRLSKVNLYPNNAKKPMTYTLDFYSYYDYKLNDRFKLRFSMLVENLLDRKNELWVNGNTGHANEAIIRATDLANHRSLFNDYEDRIINPSAISAPRYVKFGIGVMF
ncbi:TonB-dependent receptor, partial [candidate division KSB1 bacterium]|nr:TonB-dependent receptor [candidate division KSB1 bacterium]